MNMNININAITSELYKAFEYINKDFFNGEIIEPVITVQSKGNRKNVLGWCTVDKVWIKGEEKYNYEINIVAEYLDSGFEQVMTTLMHEMIHLFHKQKNIKDTSRNGAYHNKIFKNKAEDVGFDVTYDERIGYSWCTMKQQMRDVFNKYDLDKKLYAISRYSEDVDFAKRRKKAMQKAKEEGFSNEEIKEAIDKIDKELEFAKKKRKGGYIKYKCPCCDTTIRATKKVRVMCVDCNVSFVEEEK